MSKKSKNKDQNNGQRSPKPDDGKNQRGTHDRSGRKIDCTAPEQNEPHSRKRDDDVTEHWCGKCGRWGSHSTDKHDEWKAKAKANFERKKAERQQANSANSPPTPDQQTRRTNGSVTFVSALTNCGHNLAMDSELADGIDFE